MKSKKKILKRLRDAKIAYNSCMTRLAEHDEEFEALAEDAPLEIGYRQDLLQRVKTLEEIIKNNIRVEQQARKHLQDKISDLEETQANDYEWVNKVTALENQTKHVEAGTHYLLNGDYSRRIEKLEGDRHTFLPHTHVGIDDQINTFKAQITFEAQTQLDQNIAIETLQQQIKEINSRLTALITNHYLEPRPKKHPPISTEFGLAKKPQKIVSDTAPVSTRNLLAVKKSGRPRKVKS
jgi:chromosome segregation ATPase